MMMMMMFLLITTAAIAIVGRSSLSTMSGVNAFAPVNNIIRSSVAATSSSFSAFTSSSSSTSSCSSSRTTTSCLGMFFADKASAADEKKKETSVDNIDEEGQLSLDALTMEEEIELLVAKELSKTKRMSNLRNEKGVEYAPWMGISEADEGKIRSLMRERTEARRKRQEQERDVSGALFRDSQAQELSGTGLSYKIIDGEVELQWGTKTEVNTRGFIVKRRAAKTNDYSTLASYATFGPLATKGKEGGIYSYLDTTATPGGWVYRISEVDKFGNEADVCQCLVEVETEGEQKAALFAGVGFGVFAIGAFVAGIAMDPMNGYN